MKDSVPILEGLTDTERQKVLSKIPEHMHARVDKALVEAAQVREAQRIAEELGMPEKAPDTNIMRRIVTTYLQTVSSVEGWKVDKIVEAYQAKIPEEEVGVFPEEAGFAGPTLDMGDRADDDAEASEPGRGEGLG